MKKVISLVLALVMIMALGTTAFAANTNAHTITIANGTPGYTYEAYRVFEGTLVDGDLTKLDWSDGVNSSALLNELKTILFNEGENVNRPFGECVTAVDVATVLSGLADNDPVAQAFADAVAHNVNDVAGSADTMTDGKYVIDVAGDGYYFVMTSAVPGKTDTTADGVHTRYILKVVDDVNVEHKGTVPVVEKKIVEDDGSYVDFTDKNIGDTVNFVLTATLPSDYEMFKAYTVTFHDTMSHGLTLVNGPEGPFEVMIDGELMEPNFYSVVIDPDDGCSFHVVIDVKATDAHHDSKITVTYDATLNESAEIGNPGNDNKVYLQYSNNPNSNDDRETGKTPEDKVVVFTYQLDVTKVDGVNNDIKLAGAKFQFYRMNSGSKEYVMVDENSKVTGWTGKKEDASTLTSNEIGLFKIIGLDAGTYYLEETEAPAGYNKPDSDFEVKIVATISATEITDLSATVGNETSAGDKVTGIVEGTIANNSGATLPSTGGMGTTLIYVLGSVMVLGAAVLLITKKRMA